MMFPRYQLSQAEVVARQRARGARGKRKGKSARDGGLARPMRPALGTGWEPGGGDLACAGWDIYNE